MERMTSSRIFYNGFHRFINCSSTVDDLRAKVEEKIDEEWTSVLSDKDGAPANLRTEIFEVKFSIDSEILELLVVFQRLSFRFETQTLPRKKALTLARTVKILPLNVVF